jgi:hypothetical protein
MAAYDPDNIRFIRAVVKISSALYDIDEMKKSKKFKYSMKIDVSKWHEWSEDYIKEPMNVFGNTDVNALMDLIELFDDYSNKIFIKSEFNTRLNLFLAKIESAKWDLIQLADENKARMQVLISNIDDLINKGYFNSYKNYVDPYGKGYIDIVDSMNRLGETIIIGTKPENV